MPRPRPAAWIRSRTAALLVVALVALAIIPAGAQDDRIEDAKAEREAARAEAAERASDLDPLLAEDAELEAAVEALEAHVATLPLGAVAVGTVGGQMLLRRVP